MKQYNYNTSHYDKKTHLKNRNAPRNVNDMIQISGRRYMVSWSNSCIPLAPYNMVPDLTVKLTTLAPT